MQLTNDLNRENLKTAISIKQVNQESNISIHEQLYFVFIFLDF